VGSVGLSLCVLGCSGTYASPGNACSGYLVRAGGFRMLLDCGPGTLAALGSQIDIADLDAIVLSHSHPDHWLELPVLRNALRYVLGIEGLAVYGTAETLTLAEPLCAGELAPTFEWTVITDSEDRMVGPCRVRTSRTDHPPETLSIRVDLGDQSLAYSADTGPRWGFEELGSGIDVAICEATYLDAERAGGVHLTATEAGERGRSAGVSQLVLTHLIPGADSSEYLRAGAEAYGAPVHLATPGAIFTP